MKYDILHLLNQIKNGLKREKKEPNRKGLTLSWVSPMDPALELNELLEYVGNLESMKNHEISHFLFRSKLLGGDSLGYKYSLIIYDLKEKP